MPSPPLSNQLQRARQILEALQQGLHPATGRELPSDSIANDIDVNRAFGTAVLAVDQMRARMERRAQLPGNVGRSWTKEEEDTLVAAIKSGDTVPDIAARHGRTVRSIEARLEKLGLIGTSQRTTENSFFTVNREDTKSE
jgi:transposase-like protein